MISEACVAVRLKEIIDALEIQLEESSSFLDPDTGHVETVSNELLREAEETNEEPDLPVWQKQEWQVARRIVSTCASWNCLRSLRCASGQSCRTSRVRWNPTLFAETSLRLFMVGGPSDGSRTRFVGTESRQLGTHTGPGPEANRARLVRGESSGLE